jgi:hypothetical protein
VPNNDLSYPARSTHPPADRWLDFRQSRLSLDSGQVD